VDEIKKRYGGGNGFYLGFRKAVGEFYASIPYDTVRRGTIPYIETFW
jgi:hypothetical protein